MKPYSEASNKGRTTSIDDIHHSSRDCPKTWADATAKSQRKAARRQGKKEASLETAGQPNDDE